VPEPLKHSHSGAPRLREQRVSQARHEQCDPHYRTATFRLASRWLFGVPILAPQRDGAYGDIHTTALMLIAAGAALAATAIAHLLALSTPRPTVFLGWIVGLATVVAVLLPFNTTAPLASKIATAVISLVLGIAIGSLVSSVVERSMRVPVRRAPSGQPVSAAYGNDQYREY
jgi:hypothetical protein